MSQKEKEIAKTIAEALPRMDEFSKGYLLGQAELMVRQKVQEGGENVDKTDSGTESAG